MKKLLFCAVAMTMLFASVATPLRADDEITCPCGEDEMGQCLPCDEVED